MAAAVSASLRGFGGYVRSQIARSASLAVLGAALGAAVNLASPRRIPWVEDWGHHVEALAFREGIRVAGLAQTRAWLEKGRHMVFDARPMPDYESGHLPGALPWPYEAFDEHLDRYLAALSPEQPILAYCSGPDCDEAVRLLIRLRGLGFTNAVLFAGGWAEWSREVLR